MEFFSVYNYKLFAALKQSMERGAKAFVVNGNKLLVVRRSASGRGLVGQWDVPGGRAQGEEDIEQCLVREVREETGLDVEIGKYLGDKDVSEWAGFLLVVHHFECSAPDQAIVLSHEHDDYKWVALDDLKGMPDWIQEWAKKI